MVERYANLMGELTTIALATDGSSYNDGAVKEAIFFQSFIWCQTYNPKYH